jgi:universal stress protein A
MVGWSKIVCAVEFSETSRTALEFAAELARRFHAELLLVHVWRGPYPATEESAALPPALTPEEESELERRLEEWERDAEEIGGREVRTVLASGSPAAEVARIASEESADLVVAGSRGRTGFERAVMGSVAEDIVRHSPCAVLVVKAARDRGD